MGVIALLPIVLLASSVIAVPQTDPRTWLDPDDYPKSSIISDKEGALTVALEVDEKGQPSACKVIVTSAEPDLDDLTCALIMKRAQFVSAKDKFGHPTTSTFTQKVTWRIPRDKLITQGFKLTFVVDTKGRLSGCEKVEYGERDDDLRCDPQMIDEIALQMLPSPLSSYKSLSLLLAMEVDQASISIPREMNDERAIISRAFFDVSPAGIITSCKADIARSWMGKPADLCHDVIEIGSKEFDRDPDGRSRKAIVTLEISGMKR
ncbi:energy transducer TonB [Sphingobium sp. DEHP117]|uniref:energy transducer TonB n=1 Tax=Sphingobium sp. DEHP117 TaxID=2993436 RepID=UPI0027D6EE88|nr:energy transducer TonB [Sphingobium sp. DEHP117]MDQ4419759.1 energy transducer TonB [Sphingobium sp. DEHP117]